MFAARRDVRGALGALTLLVGGLEVDHERAVEAGSDPALLATDAAEALVREGVPFREAYERVAGACGRASWERTPAPTRASRCAALPGPAAWTTPCRRPGASGIDLVVHTFEDVAAAVGTPFYAYDGDLFRERIRRFRAALGDAPHLLCYALKANDALAVVRIAAEEGLGADIVSGGELEKALRAGVPAERIVFSGIGKRREEIRAALEAGVRSLNVESLGELEVVAEEAAALGAVAPVSVRLNPDVEADTHAYVATGSARSKFGLGVADARAAYERAAADPSLEPVGLSFHVGSQLLDPEPVHAAAAKAAELWRELDLPLRDLDVGGGLGIGYGGEEDAAVEPYAAALTEVAAELGAELVLEPGRWLVGPWGPS